MRIGLDLDGVCYQFDSIARYMARRHMEEQGLIPPPALYAPSKNWGWIKACVPKETWRWLWTDAVHHGLFRYGHVVEGAIKGAQELTELGTVVAITARPQDAVHDTLAWLTLMFDRSPLAGIVIQSDGQKKSGVSPRPDVYIDDGPHNFDDLLYNTSSYVVQYVQPWNADYKTSIEHAHRLIPATNWREVVEAVKKVKGDE